MKTEDLKALGLTDEQITEVHKLNGVDITALKNSNTELTEKLKGFEGVDVAQLQADNTAKDEKITSLTAEHESTVKSMQLQHKIDLKLIQSGVRNLSIVQPLIDVKSFAESKDVDKDIDARIAELKSKEDYLFISEKQPTVPTVVTGQINKPSNTEVTQAEFNRMGYRERVKLYREDPSLYEKLSKGD